MVLDTGSDVNWLQCDPCADCYTQTDPIFNPSASSTYSPVSCDSPLCSSLELSSCRSTPQHRKIDTFYYVGLSGISVGGQLLSIPEATFELDESGNGGIIVDCGTAITRLQTQAYSELRDAFVRLTPNLRRTSGVALFDTCYDMSGMKSVKVPTVAFHFSGGGRAWNLPAANYLIPVDSDGTFCFAFAPTSSSLSIIGNVQQQGTRVSFDLANKRVGFSTNKC
ncbi:Protein ASPARTIC PROTEASE IN GUARD CELL 1 [Linum perenne]